MRLCLAAERLGEVRYDGDPNYFVNKFHLIRDKLQVCFRGFEDLPAASNFEPQRLDAGRAINVLSLDFGVMSGWAGSSRAFGETPGDGGVTSALLPELDTIFLKLSNGSLFAGNAVNGLATRYHTNLKQATRGIYGLLYVYGGHIAAEQELWRLANKTLDNILNKVYEGFISAAQGSTSDANWVMVLEVVSVVIDGISLLATATGVGAPAGAAIKAVGLGVTVLKVIAKEDAKALESKQDTMSSYDEVLSFIDNALSAFRSAVLKEEEDIEANIKINMAAIEEHRDFYDLTGELFEDRNRGLDDGGNIRWDAPAADQVASAMQRASAFYESAGRSLDDTSIWDAATRPPGLGRPYTGPAQVMDDFGSTLRALLLALGEELMVGAAHVNSATKIFMENEQNSTGTIYLLESQLDLTPFSTLESSSTTLDPLADDAPDVAPLRIKEIMGPYHHNV